MPFNSPQFLVFGLALVLLNFFSGAGLRRWILLGGSLLFILSFNGASAFAVLILGTFNFFMAPVLSRRPDKFLFYTAVAVNCLAIVINNYIVAVGGRFLFSLSSIEFQSGNLLWIIGLSFYSLQHISYLAEVQAKHILPEKNYPDFLWMSCYFPKFISGPITPYPFLKEQMPLSRPRREQLFRGFNRLLFGFFKKMVIADRLAPSVSSVFDYQDQLAGITILIAAVLFTLELYFDFSGYCDIAIGISLMLGIQLPENFDFPLRSASVTVFWRKWHKTLIQFLSSYVFYPIAFRYRKWKKAASALAIFCTFLISALWHGIGLTFLAWASCHMFYLLAELYGRRKNPILLQENTVMKLSKMTLVLFLVAFSNIFFRASSAAQAGHLFSGLIQPGNFFPGNWATDFVAPLAVGGHQAEHFNMLITLLILVITLVYERRIFYRANSDRFQAVMTWAILMLIFLFGVFNSGQRFIYMQF